MFIELVDVLRCVRPHEDSWLVLSASKMEDRQVIDGELGCPVCRARYPIREGAVYFDFAVHRAVQLSFSDPARLPDAAFRIAALLGLAEPGGIVVVAGGFVVLASQLAMIAGDTQIVCLNPIVTAPASASISGLHSERTIPLASASCRGIAVESACATDAWLEECVRVLKVGGRLMAPVGATVPAEMKELARDDEAWVAERTTASSGLVSIGTSRRK